MALIAHSATLEARVPFLHFFDGFRISHEVNKIEQLTEDDVRAMIDMDLVARPSRSGPSRPSGRSSAARPRTRTSSSRPARPATRSTPPAPASCRSTWTSSPSLPAGSITCSTTSAPPTPSA